MTPILLVLALCFQAPAKHLHLHPREAALYLEVPDLPELLEAYETSPFLGLLRSDQGAALAAALVPTLEPSDPAAAWLGASVPQVLPYLPLTRAFSFSATDPSDGAFAGFLLVLEADSAESASELRARLESLAQETVPLAADLPAAIALKLPGVKAPLWVSQQDRRVLLGGGAVSPNDVVALQAESGRTLASDESLARAFSTFVPANPVEKAEGARNRATVFWFAQRSHAFDVLRRLDDSLGVFGGRLVRSANPIPPTIDPWNGPRVVRVCLEDGVFRRETFEPSPTEVAGDPVSTERIADVPAGAMLVFASSFDWAPLASFLGEWIRKAPVGESSEAEEATVTSAVDEILARLSSTVLAYAFPVEDLGPPRAFLWVDLKGETDAQAAIADALTKIGATVPGVTTRTRDHLVRAEEGEQPRSFPVTTIGVPKELLQLGPFFSVSPSFAVVDGRLLLGLRSTHVKDELDRLYGALGEARALDPLAARGLRIPEDASSILFVDWAAQIGAILTLVDLLEPLLGDRLPLSLRDLPAAGAVSEHLSPTVRVGRRVEGGEYFVTSSSLGPESWALFGAGLSAIYEQPQDGADGTIEAHAEQEGSPPAEEE